ncbi:GNAT family N-acetyltransferase [Agrobacterium tumefaciens]|jgi:GNAT superfamily N-acetyltransferase|uniref:GNAT family N-acetyltransferase n=1 Tax=Agrobacterium tumefaciens TaxID=358 RepID=UPI000EF19B94|nr:GNAT family N-acetyltransferase [Agrobacterium tumefaciens]NSZ36014.1 GNAT family N-acetyltransferase [Agrobacterium tumefaciens]QLG25276.1 GNAT family N-acetyltransferase [Agrobacterium tumefaciens]UXS87435.1 GNAT family N-acetyltransferase [Agrobacterium tumefaciens]
MEIRTSKLADLPKMVSFAESRRFQYQEYQPTFWRKADNSAQITNDFFQSLLDKAGWHCFSAYENDELQGFLIARETTAPPVYAPGGPTITVDDFCVRTPDEWSSAGKALVDHLLETAREKGWAQLVIVCGDRDDPKKTMLQDAGLSVASNWFTVPVRGSGVTG